MKSLTDINLINLALAYILLIIPLAIILWLKLPLISKLIIAIIRMSVQLLFIGFYLQVVFKLNSPLLNLLCILAMITVADISIIRSLGFKQKYFIIPVGVSILLGILVPLLVFLHVVLLKEKLFDAQYAIPIGGMILGNCLRANIVGIGHFYNSIRADEKTFMGELARGATLKEAITPYLRDASTAAFAPTIATITTIGLISLPGMMTGVIMGGNNPMAAIKYQIAIMIAILTGTVINVPFAILLSSKKCFNSYGMLVKDIFKTGK
jgi:putative ABC transport system permease protein